MTVFSYSDLVLIIDGTPYTAEYLSGVTISKSGGGIGTSGVTTTCLTARVKVSFPIDSGAVITIKYRNWEFPTYYVNVSDYNGYYVSLTAYDLCKDLDLPFDRSSYKKPDSTTENEDKFENENSSSTSSTDKEETNNENRFLTTLVLGDLANQIGFKDCGHSSEKTYLTYSDLDGSCRTILQKISEADCGVFYCGNDNTLKFVSFENSSSAGYSAYGDYSVVAVQPEKNITQIIAEDTKNNKTYTYGSGGYKSSLTLSGDFLDKETSQNIASRIFQNGGKYTYSAFSVDNAIISSNIEVFGLIEFMNTNNAENVYRKCSDIVIKFGALTAVAALSSTKITENKVTYADKMYRLLNERIKLNTAYGNYFIDKNNGIEMEIEA